MLPRFHMAMPRLRWVLLGLYVALVGSLFCIIMAQGSGREQGLVVVMLVTQLLFIFGAGTKDLCKPIRRRRLWLPVVVAGAMLAVLAGSGLLATSELLDMDDDWIEYGIFPLMGVNWIVWGVLLFIYTRHVTRFRALQRMVGVVLGGSLLELLSTIPSHIIVVRRPGCFVGLYTMIGIAGGVYVMLWAFGPGILLLFLRERRQRELDAKQSVPREPSDG